MVATDLSTIIDRHIAAFNAKDVADYMADYAPEAIVDIGSRRLTGHEPIRDHFARAFVIDPSLVLEVAERRVEGSVVTIRWVSKKGRRIAARGCEEYRFDEHGRILHQSARRDGR